MSTRVITPITVASLEPAWLSNWIALVKAHEKLFIALLIGVLSFFAYDKAVTAWDKHEQRVDAAEQQKVVAAAAKTAADDKANAVLALQLDAMRAEYKASELKLQAQIAAEKAALSARQAHDDALPLPDLAQRWVSIMSLNAGDINATADGRLSVSSEAAHNTVDELEKLPVVAEELVKTEADLAGCQQLSAKQDTVIAGLNTRISDGNTALTAEKNARAADKKAAKAAQRKAWLKGFAVGAVTGFVAGLFVGHGI
jgi:ElaB/YqjD/DUF883 family membrane-anchored ribosome-binding protein